MYLAFDIGGSSTKVGIIDNNEKIIEKYSIRAKSNLEEFIKMLEEEVEKNFNKYGIKGVGFSSPGSVNPETGEVGGISALEYIHTYNFAKHIKNKFNIPVAIENDANCSALSEMYFSEIKEKRVAFFVIGSGVGGAIIENGELARGRRLEAGEFGYMLLKREDNKYYNLSQLATLPNVKRRMDEKYKVQENAFEIFEKFLKKESPYYEVVDEMFDYLCMGIYNVSYAIDPELVLIGGGVSQSDEFINEIKNRLSKEPYKDANIKIKPVKYFNDNNLLGAYVNLKKLMERK